MSPRSRRSWRPPNAARLLRQLGLPDRFELEELTGAVERQRGRPLKDKVASLPAEYSAMWYRTPRVDYIIVAEGMSGPQRKLAYVHELAHMVLEHRPRVVTSSKQLQAALGVPELMHSLARSGISRDSREEAEAEALATAICTRLQDEGCAEGDERAARFRHSLS